MSSQTTDKLAEEIQAIIWQVEKCGASPDLTKAVIMLGELRDSVMKSIPAEGKFEKYRCPLCHSDHTGKCSKSVPVEK